MSATLSIELITEIVLDVHAKFRLLLLVYVWSIRMSSCGVGSYVEDATRCRVPRALHSRCTTPFMFPSGSMDVGPGEKPVGAMCHFAVLSTLSISTSS